ncbi:MAG: DUF6249 domain-containing protein [Candidatus Amulumruptor caecigallinarius]|nr:DUF6249 domain-containing protein [Candidatus Amulumruptor caecigallinarius]MCM1396076.1 DUF6249 domain-containing protein [Candidatus Amulumruptor caecigallinarius]MCM1453915.1 DUF6249 domain-containing protein [bacterium]
MRHILLSIVMLCFMSIMAAAAPQSAATQTVKAEAGKAATVTRNQLNAARQAADVVNFDSIEANIDSALADMPSAETTESFSTSTFVDDDDDFDASGLFGHDSSTGLARMAIFGIFIMPPLAVVLIVLIVLYFRSRNKRAQYEAMARAAQNGVILPPIPEGTNNASPNAGAVTLIAVGIGIAIFFACIDEWELGIGVGCIPALIGAARLVTRWLDNRER